MLLKEMNMDMEGSATYKDSVLQKIAHMYVPKTPGEADLLDQMIGDGIAKRKGHDEVASDYMEQVRATRASSKF